MISKNNDQEVTKDNKFDTAFVSCTWLAGGWGSRGSPCLTLTDWISLMGSPVDSPLVWPGVFFSITGILSSTAALQTEEASQHCVAGAKDLFLLSTVKILNATMITSAFQKHSILHYFIRNRNISSSLFCIPHVVIFLEQSIIFNCPLLELHIYTAAIDADDAPDATGRG